jgi:hypothetical protein
VVAKGTARQKMDTRAISCHRAHIGGGAGCDSPGWGLLIGKSDPGKPSIGNWNAAQLFDRVRGRFDRIVLAVCGAATVPGGRTNAAGRIAGGKMLCASIASATGAEVLASEDYPVFVNGPRQFGQIELQGDVYSFKTGKQRGCKRHILIPVRREPAPADRP